MKSIVTIGVVRHDTDILETCLRHAASFADAMLLRLHRPTPVLRAMAHALRAEGLPLHLSESKAMHYDQKDAMNDLLTEAVTQHAADLVLPLDADEFLGGSADLRAALHAAPADKPSALAWRTYVPTPSDDLAEPHPLRRIRHRRTAENPGYSKMLIPAFLVRGSAVSLTMGSHTLEIDGKVVPAAPSRLFLAHYPVRSDRQLRTKVLCGWLSHQANAARKPGQIFQWERLFERCKDRNPLDLQELQAIALSYAQDDVHTALEEDPLQTASSAPRMAQETQEPWTIFMQDTTLLAATP